MSNHISDATPLYQPSNEEINATFRSWTRFPMQSVVDYWFDGTGICHVYTIPFHRRTLPFMTNRFRRRDFGHVKELLLADYHPFEHDFFHWLAQSCPLLATSRIINMIAQNKTVQKNVFVCFKHLTLLSIRRAHPDYVRQFLHEERSRLPTLFTFQVTYENLNLVTDTFTNEKMRHNCSKLHTLKW